MKLLGSCGDAVRFRQGVERHEQVHILHRTQFHVTEIALDASNIGADTDAMKPHLPGAIAVIAVGLAAACDSSDDGRGATSTTTASTASQAPPAAAGGDELILDYTLYVEGGIQVSGLDSSADRSRLALVTDMEEVLIFDIEQFAVTETFSVQLAELPRQGSTEAIAFTADDEIAVLYPDVSLIRRYSTNGELRGEIDLSTHQWELAGAMTTAADGSLLLVTSTPSPTVLGVNTEGNVTTTMDLDVDTAGEIVGVSTAGDDTLYAVTEDSVALLADLQDGTVEPLPAINGVGSPSDIEYFVNPEDEAVLAITDDADEYNQTEGPIRLYLAP
jgi:hypothetical protein